MIIYKTKLFTINTNNNFIYNMLAFLKFIGDKKEKIQFFSIVLASLDHQKWSLEHQKWSLEHQKECLRHQKLYKLLSKIIKKFVEFYASLEH